MGQLTFQATLGGAVNLAGPNTASTTTFTLPAADGTAGQALTTNASGTLAFANIALASAVSGTLPIANGGTNSTATATAGGVGYGTGTAHAYTSAGSSGQFLQSNGSSAPSWVAAPSGGYTLGTPVATTSGTSIDFTGIPAGVKQIVITFNGVSTDGTSAKLIQIGDSGGIETSGYSSTGYILTTTVAAGFASAGYAIYSESAGHSLRGSVILTLESSSTNTWCAQGVLSGNTSSNFLISGDKSLSATLDRVRITTELGTQNFDAGSINIAYM